MDAAAMVDGEEGGIFPIEVWLDCRISSGLLLGDVEVEDMILDQDQATGENGEVEREDCPDSRIEDWAEEESRIGAVEKRIAGNVVEHGLLHSGIVLDTYKNIESCKPEEVSVRKFTDICAAFDEDKEIEEGEIPGNFGLISNTKSVSFSEWYGSKVQSDVSLCKRANVVEMNSGYSGSCITKEENIRGSRGREKMEVSSGVIVSPQKIAKKRRRAEIDKKLGVKRLKLVPISKPKVAKSCKHYLHGRCQQDDECKFSHDAVPFTKSQHFARDSCLKGDDCPFDHELFKYPCHNYMSRGSRFRGDSCLFSHKVQLSHDNSNASEVKCLVASERASLGKDCQGNSKIPLAIFTLSRAGTSPSTTSTLRKSSLTQQPNDLFSTKTLNPYVMKTTPKGISFLSFCSDTTTSNVFINNKKETGSNPTFKNFSKSTMPSLVTSLHSPSSSPKMLMPLEARNFASSSRGNQGNGFIAQSPAPKLQSSLLKCWSSYSVVVRG